MATYRLEIRTDNTVALWPALAAFDGMERARRDAFFLQVRKAGYEAMRGVSLLDRRIAHEFMRAIERAEKRGLRDTGTERNFSGAGFTFYIWRD